MRKRYDIHSFSYINNSRGMNVLNGSKGSMWDECYEEFNVACFNGVAYFKSNCGYYKMTYPKFNELSFDMKLDVQGYCGFIPEAGEYGVICGTYGDLKKITKKEFVELSKEYPIKKSEYQLFDWLNGNIE